MGLSLSFGRTGSNVDQNAAQTFARRNMRTAALPEHTTSVESGLLFDSLPGMPRWKK